MKLSGLGVCCSLTSLNPKQNVLSINKLKCLKEALLINNTKVSYARLIENGAAQAQLKLGKLIVRSWREEFG